jgi:hypothetical protein
MLMTLPSDPISGKRGSTTLGIYSCQTTIAPHQVRSDWQLSRMKQGAARQAELPTAAFAAPQRPASIDVHVQATASGQTAAASMRVFTRVVERRSFTLAAEDLALPRSTVTDAVKQLETRLGVRLIAADDASRQSDARRRGLSPAMSRSCPTFRPRRRRSPCSILRTGSFHRASACSSNGSFTRSMLLEADLLGP